MSGSSVQHEHSTVCSLAVRRGRPDQPAVCCPLLSAICTLHVTAFLAMLPRVRTFPFIPLWFITGLLPDRIAALPCQQPAAQCLPSAFTPLYRYFTLFCILFTLSDGNRIRDGSKDNPSTCFVYAVICNRIRDGSKDNPSTGFVYAVIRARQALVVPCVHGEDIHPLVP
jgi:hypothetical protein